MVTTPPADRRPILTHVGEFDEAAVVEAIRRELLREGQVFFVHNRVSDIDQVARRVGQLVPDARVAVAHGQMDEGTLERVMIDFWERRFDVLVCTTIVESGIDLPSVNTLDRRPRRAARLGQCTSCAAASAQRPARLRLPLSPGGPGALRDGLRAPAHDRRQHRARQRLQDRHARPRDPWRGKPARPRPVGSGGGGGLRPLRRNWSPKRWPTPRGSSSPEVAPVTLDVPGEAHLPKSYVEADDARLEAYRRLAGVTTPRRVRRTCVTSGSTATGRCPTAARGYSNSAQLRLRVPRVRRQLGRGVARASGRAQSSPVVKMGPLDLTLSQQCAFAERRDRRPTTKATKELRVEVSNAASTPRALLEMLALAGRGVRQRPSLTR